MGPQHQPPAPPRLGLWDTISIIVGIIVGVGIYKTPATVFAWADTPAQALGVWALGGFLALLGALCFAELASAYPRSGGEYVYLTRAYGSPVGFLFAWAQFAVIRPGGGIAMPAYILGEEAEKLWGLARTEAMLLAALAIAVLTAINILGANPGRRTQNLFTVAKVVSLAAIIVTGLFFVRPRPLPVSNPAPSGATFVVVMMGVLYAFDGWNEAACVSAEVHKPRRNLPRALLLGVAGITVLYLLINLAYLVGLGFATVHAEAVGPHDILEQALGATAGRAMSALIIVSVLGALTGMIFTGSRLFSEVGADHRLFALLARWDPQLQTPVWSLLIQGSISIAMLLSVGLLWQNKDGFETLLNGTSPALWLCFFLTGLSVILLRKREPEAERPFRVKLHPLVPLLFCSWCLFMLYGTIHDAPKQALVGVALVLAGLPLYAFSRWLERRRSAVDCPPPCDSLVGSTADHPGDATP